ncbi:MAG: hypothetical protein ACOYI6_04940 [Christensenellales bacterium]|jgi:hypothetical protein|nr:hypothetical protein [Clostridiales bacterium]
MNVSDAALQLTLKAMEMNFGSDVADHTGDLAYQKKVADQFMKLALSFYEEAYDFLKKKEANQAMA